MQRYTTQLQAGLGLVAETKSLLDLWSAGMSTRDLYNTALQSGTFPGVTARRLRNIIAECFAPRYLVNDAAPATHLKILIGRIGKDALNQLLLIFTCRANAILADFIREVYWGKYEGGHKSVSNEDAASFVQRSVDRGLTVKTWEASTIQRVSSYLTGCCADYGLLEKGQRRERRILPLSLTTEAAVYLAYDLHFSGLGDNSVINHPEWELFGINRDETLDEIKRLAAKNMLIVQSAGDAVRISWKYETMEQLCNVIDAA